MTISTATQTDDASAAHVLLFVYGTLKRGDCRHYLIQKCRFLGEVHTLPGYRLFNCGSYPGMIEDPQGIAVRGELYEVSLTLLSRLDEEEGVDIGLYERKPVQINTHHGLMPVLTYLYRKPTAGLPELGLEWVVK